MSDVVVTLSGDEAKLVRAMMNVVNKNAQVGESFKDTGKEAKKAADAAIREAERVEKASKKAAEDIYREHEKLKAKQVDDARQAAIDELKILERELAQEIRAVEESEAHRKRIQDKAIADKQKSLEKSQQYNQGIIDKVVGIGAAYMSIQSVVSAYTQNVQQQLQLQKENLEVVERLGKAQAGSLPNLAGLSDQQKKDALNSAKDIQGKTGFADREKLTETIGVGYGAIGNIEAAKSATEAAAGLSILNENDLQPIATGALDVMKATGVNEGKKVMSYLMQVGSDARVEDPTKLSTNVAPAIKSGILTTPNQDKVDAAKEQGAFFSVANQAATDVTGESTKTNQIKFASAIEGVFSKLPEKRKEIQEKEFELNQKLSMGNGDKFDLEKRDKYRQQLKDLEGVSDSGTFFGRIDQIVGNKALQDIALENPIGEAAFQGVFKDILTNKDSQFYKEMKVNKEKYSLDSTKEYDSTVLLQQTATPEARLATASKKADAQEQIDRDAETLKLAEAGKINEIATAALQKNRRRQVGGGLDMLYEQGEEMFGPTTEDINKVTAFSLTRLENRKKSFGPVENLDEADREKVRQLDLAMERIEKLFAEITVPRTASSLAAEQQLMERQNQLLESIDSKLENGSGMPQQAQAVQGANEK